MMRISKEDPLVSIIIPVYNTEQHLQKCLDSVINQTYHNIEIILIDDGSTDNSGKICDDYAKKDDRVKVYHQKNSGVSCARNLGLDVAQGEYISFIDSDDYIDCELLQQVVSKVRHQEFDIIIFGYNEIKANGIYPIPIDSNVMLHNKTENILEDVLMDRIPNFPCNKIYKKNLWDVIRFPLGHIYEDMFVIPQVFAQAKIIGWISSPLYYYNRCNYSSITGKNNDFSSLNRYSKFLAYCEHERIAKKLNFINAERWAISKSIHEGIKALYIHATDQGLDDEKILNIQKYLMSHDSDLLSKKYKILRNWAINYPKLLLVYGYIRYYQQRLK